MNSRLLMTLQVTVAAPEKIGAVPLGTRVTAPISSGRFEGPRLRGKVLPGGGDWTLLRADGVLELDSARHPRDRRRRAHPHDVVRASSWATGRDRGARARRARRPFCLLLPHDAALRDRGPEVRVLESPPRRVERRSARRRPHLHHRRDPVRPRWTLDEGTLSSSPRSRRSPDARRTPRGPPLPSRRQEDTAMRSRPLMTLRLDTAPTQDIGPGPHGMRVTFPITGGSFEGERLSRQGPPGRRRLDHQSVRTESSSSISASRSRPTTARSST